MTKLFNRIVIFTYPYPFQEREWAVGLFRHANHGIISAFKLAKIVGNDVWLHSHDQLC